MPPPPSHDPIFSPLTPYGDAAICSFLLDGRGSFSLFEAIFRKPAPFSTMGGRAMLGLLHDQQEILVDEAVASLIHPTESNTTFEQVELSCHGGRGVRAAVEDALTRAGFRRALPGELSARAHRVGKLAIMEIEARMHLPGATTGRQAAIFTSAAMYQERWERHGFTVAMGVREESNAWRDILLQAAREEMQRADAIARLLATHRIVLAGSVNAGKSTLANRLLRSERNLVSAEPGTTRDVLERPAAIHGFHVLLCDTAGLRDLPDAPDEQAGIEAEGQRRAREAMNAAALVLYVLDASQAPSEAECALAEQLATRPILLVLNKTDLGLHPEAEGLAFALACPAVRISARDGAGLESLSAAIATVLSGGTLPSRDGPFTKRQRAHHEKIAKALEDGLDAATIIGHIRNLIGTRPNEFELAACFHEATGAVDEHQVQVSGAAARQTAENAS